MLKELWDRKDGHTFGKSEGWDDYIEGWGDYIEGWDGYGIGKNEGCDI